MISSTGHLAISHAVTAADPTPSALPSWSAIEPVATTMTRPATRQITVNSVISSRVGAVFQIGRPSSTP